MAISFVSSTSAVQNTASTTISINVPSGTANNDLMILIVTAGAGGITWTTPSGWTVWKASSNSRAIYYRTASSEPASYTITQSSSNTSDGYILTYRDAAIDVMGNYSPAASPSVAPSITTTANNAYVFYFIASPGNASVTYTTPTGYTALVSDLDATAPSSAIFYITQATAGATGSVSSTGSTGNPLSLLFSIIPTATVTVNSNFFFMMG